MGMESNALIIKGFLESRKDAPVNTYKSLQNDCDILNEYLTQENLFLCVLSEQEAADSYLSYLKQKRQDKDATVKRRLCTLRAILAWCQKEGYLFQKRIALQDDITLKHVDLVPDEALSALYHFCIRITESSEYKQVRARIETLFVLLFGFKVTELSRMRVSDCGTHEISFQCGNSPGIRFFDRPAISESLEKYLLCRSDFLEQYGFKTDSLFVNRFGRPIVENTIHRDFHWIRENSGVSDQITLTGLRNTCILYYYQTIPDAVIMKKMFQVNKDRIAFLQRNCRTAR